jgi:Ca2+-binding EF-hand superfamily protein
LVRDWGGFDASERFVREFFDWMDKDGDNRISLEDLRQSVGKEINPPM